ncbi:hypothetical protein C900_00501 [Fulvivirga imtechensis AK7]|uniref:HTH cro/C1-type domain-containing protein n=1 Tax=Fulvivirga imtechensis AK7 TaxID=1237149 RepID=L8JZB4_9BACT|nr:helix-turn-helix domain-containing protein [Fulvivirga imtechensis]ELR72999.1 hypothetical protein C900_00501 [Fulvivirga imtechensis AK7]
MAKSKNKIAFFRKRRGFTQDDIRQEIYKRTGKKFTQGTISSWENGNTAPDMNILNILASILDVSVNAFYEPDQEDEDIINRAELARFEQDLREAKLMFSRDQTKEAFTRLETLSGEMLEKLSTLSTSYEKMKVQVKAVREIMKI